MDYKKVIEDFQNGTIDRTKWVVVMDNDGGYWAPLDDDILESEVEEMESKYGSPDGYGDIVDYISHYPY